ncbi:HlyD family type I secretion periplasmic adaptor subunit [Pollutimonas bauzanensis]|uniref:Membrane fusion protein (MFP) family protein n=1 Tax=Pollutimonas bauzanensis TaxID=658167 RepID=A0A1M5ZMM9_9BURK|nr:HlyD family type I secretion periplasmic adaptor subunit [Pollutimonas bauzanensis]SHI25577.1 membrane fusion protein HasE [Pollutimonas bauzanensis]
MSPELSVSATAVEGIAAPKDALLSADGGHYVRLGWLIVLVGVVGFMAWAALAPLDAGVPVEAKVVVSGNRKAVQPMAAGKVRRILVADGVAVREGQTLVELVPTVPANQLDSLRFQYLSSLATENRLMAERDSLARIRFEERLLETEHSGNAQVAEIIQAQQQLFDSRRRAQQAALDGLEAVLRGAREQRDSLQRILQSRREQRVAFRRQLQGQSSLADDGLLARNRLLEAERQYLQLAGSVADDEGRLGVLEGQVQEYQLRLIQQREDYQKELRTALADTRTRTADLLSRLDSAQYELANTQILAPVAGIVSGLAVFTDGGVVSAGQKLMDIVPLDQPLMVEGKLPVQSVDKVHPGQPVELEFAAFNRATTPKLPGTVTTVSADRLEDQQGMPYYHVEISVDELQGRQAGPGLILQPGMPVTAFVKTGERTLMNYLFKPLRDRTRLALTEQ